MIIFGFYDKAKYLAAHPEENPDTAKKLAYDSRLERLESELSDTRQRLAHLEGSLGGR